jgi:hypothetical protein
MPLPTFFVIGAPRSGSTSLYQYLSLHPEITMSRIKEPHFFVDNVRRPAVRVDDLAEYEALFSSETKVRGEASPSYACYSQHSGAPERISALLPAAKFIYLVRDPIDRTVSHYVHRVAVENERRPFADALGHLDDPANPYTCPSRYATQLERYLRYFPMDRIMVIDQGDLLRQRTETLSAVFSFLGVDEGFASSGFDEERGASEGRRRYSTRYLRLSERAASSPLRILPRGTRRSLRAVLERLMFRPVERPSITPELRERLEALYSPEVSRLRTLTAKPFSTWSL